MKKLNNKGFTVVELTLSFLFVFTLAFSMYELLFNYRTKQNEEAIKAQLVDYSNQVTLAIQNDISEKTLKNIDYCMSGGSAIDKCLILNFNDSTSKQLSVEKRDYEYDGEMYKISYINYGGVYYESSDAILLDYRPNYMLYNTYESDNLEDENVNIYKISIPIYHNDLEGNYGIEIVTVGYDYEEPEIKSGGVDTIDPGPENNRNIAIYSSSDQSLSFINIVETISVGDTYDGKNISKIYVGFEEEKFTSSTVPWLEIRDQIKSVNIDVQISPTSTAHWFNGFINCTTFNLSNLDTSNVESMASMFYSAGENVTGAFKITGMENWDTSKVTTMAHMFYHTGQNASSYSISALTNWDTSNVVYMQSMFSRAAENAPTFNIGNLKNWDTSKVTSMAYMFYHAGHIATTWNIGDLSSWDTSNVTNMYDLFAATGINATTWSVGNLKNWNTSKVTNMGYMFYKTGYSASTFNLGDLSNWNVSKVTNMNQMFCKSAAASATTFYISSSDKLNWDTSNVTNMDQMFNDAGKNASYSLDLSSWDVNKVGSDLHTYFNNNVESKITSPSWVS